MRRALMRPGILPAKLIVAVSSQCRLPRNLPSIKADRQTTLLLPRSPLPVRWTSPRVRIVRRWRGRFLANPQFQSGFRRKRREVATALATNRAFRRCILHLLEATVWAFQTDFCRRRTGHRTLTPEFPSLSAPSERCLDWLAGSHNFGADRGRLRGNCTAGDFGFTNKSCSLLNDKPRCFQIALQCAF